MAVDQLASSVEEFLDSEYPLTDEQIASLHEDGWTLLPGLFNQELVELIYERLSGQPLRTRTVDAQYRKLKPGENVAPNSNLSHNGMSFRDPFFRRVVTSRRVGGVAPRLMRREQALVAEDTSYIKPDGGGPTNPHQDYSYRPFDRWGEVVIWSALVDMSPDMGPLYYLQGSHREGPLGLHGGFDLREQHPHLYERKIVAGQALSAGDAQAHWDLTVHGAVPNTTDRHRAAYAVRFMRTDMCYSGIGNPHFDSLELTPGTKFIDSGRFPIVDENGLVEG